MISKKINDNIPSGLWYKPDRLLPDDESEVIIKSKATGTHEVCVYYKEENIFSSSVYEFSPEEVDCWAFMSSFLPPDLENLVSQGKSIISRCADYSKNYIQGHIRYSHDRPLHDQRREVCFSGFNIEQAYLDGACEVLKVIEPLTQHTPQCLESGYASLVNIIKALNMLKGLRPETPSEQSSGDKVNTKV